MERKLGEVFEVDDVKFMCIPAAHGCQGCCFRATDWSCMAGFLYRGVPGICYSYARRDGIGVIFVPLEDL